VDSTEKGFVIEWTERWTDDVGMNWYCRELARADSRTVGSKSCPFTARATGTFDPSRSIAPRSRS
jgi:hypothetical protein